jgi:hypothetical protein
MAIMVDRIEAGRAVSAEELESRQARLAEPCPPRPWARPPASSGPWRQRWAGCRDDPRGRRAPGPDDAGDLRALPCGQGRPAASFADFTEASRTMGATLQAVQKASGWIQVPRPTSPRPRTGQGHAVGATNTQPRSLRPSCPSSGPPSRTPGHEAIHDHGDRGRIRQPRSSWALPSTRPGSISTRSPRSSPRRMRSLQATSSKR